MAHSTPNALSRPPASTTTRLRRIRRALGWAVLASALTVGLSCRGNPEVSFELDIAQSVVGKAAWFEIGAFSEGYCQAIKPVMAAGMPLDGSLFRVAFKKDNPAPPAKRDRSCSNDVSVWNVLKLETPNVL